VAPAILPALIFFLAPLHAADAAEAVNVAPSG
jgi:hypothetical protein